MAIVKRMLLALFLSSLSGMLIFILAYLVAVAVSPPEFFDESTGELHRVMPLGQAMLAGLIAIIGGLAMLIVVYHNYSRIMSRFSRRRA
ncbi:MAG: hypothetical protein ACXVPQ_09235 [Bacteroidia bacterium]